MVRWGASAGPTGSLPMGALQ